MKEFLSRKGVDFVESDITQDEAALDELVALGFMTTPVTVIDDQVIVGFNQVKLEELLAK
ncbi:MAG: glutaredoxin family protein [Anaerolineae bacterium]